MGLTTTSGNAALQVAILAEAVEGALAGVQLLLGTGAWTFLPKLPTAQTNGLPIANGTTINIPYFDHIGEMDDVSETGALIPRAITSSDEQATITHSGIANEASVLAVLTSQAADPYAEGARQIAQSAKRRLDKAAIDAAKLVASSMVNDQGANAGADFDVLLFKRGAGITWYTVPEAMEDVDVLAHTKVQAIHVYHATHLWSRPRGGVATRPGVAKLIVPAASFSEDLVLDTAAKFGDEVNSEDPIVMCAMHSTIANAAKKLKDSTGRRLYVDGPMVMSPIGMIKGGPDTFCGIPVYVSDKLTAS